MAFKRFASRLFTVRQSLHDLVSDSRPKILLGVGHQEPSELKKVKHYLRRFLPHSVGLELPEDYRFRESWALETRYFSDVESYLSARNAKVVPLEDPELYSYGEALESARQVVQEKRHLNALRVALQVEQVHLSDLDPIAQMDETCQTMYWIERYTKALEILGQASSQEEFNILFRLNNQRREAKVLEKIAASNLDMVIIGDSHAQALYPSLPGFQYLSLYYQGKNV